MAELKLDENELKWFTEVMAAERHTPAPLLPDPEPRAVNYTVISVDDHLCEPPHVFEGRVPSRYASLAPRVIEGRDGSQAWTYDGILFREVGLNASAGRAREEREVQALRFDEIREGCWNVDARVRDMDIDGIWGSVNFPSMITGFCGTVFSRTKDQDLGFAVMRAWNDWFFEEWYGPHPDRVVPMGITWMSDPELGAEEVRRNAERGFTAITLPERPHRIGFPSLYSGYWDPIVAACVETETTICLHVGSTGLVDIPDDAPMEVGASLFQAASMQACVEWLWSGVPVRFPDVKIALSEGGMGWVPMLHDRLQYMKDRSHAGQGVWPSTEITPSEALARNFWFCMIDDHSTLPLRHRIGLDHIMVETDYPHADTTWPDTQALLRRDLEGLPLDEIRKITHENAAALFRHPLPVERRP